MSQEVYPSKPLRNNPRSRVEYLIDAAQQSKYNASHWMRYLRKEYENDKFLLNEYELKELLENEALTMFQKISLIRAANPNTETSKYISSLNKKATTPMVEEMKRKFGYIDE